MPLTSSTTLGTLSAPSLLEEDVTVEGKNETNNDDSNGHDDDDTDGNVNDNDNDANNNEQITSGKDSNDNTKPQNNNTTHNGTDNSADEVSMISESPRSMSRSSSRSSTNSTIKDISTGAAAVTSLGSTKHKTLNHVEKKNTEKPKATDEDSDSELEEDFSTPPTQVCLIDEDEMMMMMMTMMKMMKMK